MTHHVFIAGHGRMLPNGKDIAVPANVTIHWTVRAGYNSTGSLSSAVLRGDWSIWEETKTTGEVYKQHFLCPDTSDVMAAKGTALIARQVAANDGGTYWLLQPKDDFAVSLSQILAYLGKVPEIQGAVEIYWTCCRSPIGDASRGKVEFEAGVLPSSLEFTQPGTKTIKHPNKDPFVRNVTSATGADTGSGPTGNAAGRFEGARVMTDSVEGALTLKNRTLGATLGQPQTWPSKPKLAEDAVERPVTRRRANSGGGR